MFFHNVLYTRCSSFPFHFTSKSVTHTAQFCARGSVAFAGRHGTVTKTAAVLFLVALVCSKRCRTKPDHGALAVGDDTEGCTCDWTSLRVHCDTMTGVWSLFQWTRHLHVALTRCVLEHTDNAHRFCLFYWSPFIQHLSNTSESHFRTRGRKCSRSSP